LSQPTYANRSNMEYLEQIYAQYQDNPDSVDASWKQFFEGMEFGQSRPIEGAEFNRKELDVYRLIRAYRDYGHLKADLRPS
jgi:2-oxoglutarate dehydrogenase E1 component